MLFKVDVPKKLVYKRYTECYEFDICPDELSVCLKQRVVY